MFCLESLPTQFDGLCLVRDIRSFQSPSPCYSRDDDDDDDAAKLAIAESHWLPLIPSNSSLLETDSPSPFQVNIASVGFDLSTTWQCIMDSLLYDP